MKIVVLQRSLTNQRIFTNVLAKTGYGPVHLTDSKIQAQKLCTNGDPGMLIGEKSLRRTEETYLWDDWYEAGNSRQLAVIVTGYQFAEREAVQFIRSGADELLILPFDPDRLLEKVQSAC